MTTQARRGPRKRWLLIIAVLVLPFSYALASGPDTALDADVASVTTLAGDGADATVDGVGSSASFKQMGGVVVTGGSAYVGTIGSIRKVNLATGSVSTLAGDSSALGCTDSTTASLVRFNFIYDVATDGTDVFSVAACSGSNQKIRRTAIATGATSTVATVFNARSIVVGSDGMLYVATGASKTVVRVDPSSGAQTTLATTAGDAFAITGDATYLWVAVQVTTSDRRIQRVTISDGTITTLVTNSGVGLNALQSAGSYLYGTLGAGHGLRRYDKSSGTWRIIAGTGTAGYVDGTGTDAWLFDVWGIASDGVSLWIADSGNRRIRKAVDTSPQPSSQPPSATTTLVVDPAAVTTVAGSGNDATVDGVGSAASFTSMGGVVVVDGRAYIGTVGSIRRVNLATGEVTILAGHATETSGCADASNPASVRFSGITDIATDGYYLYSVGGCPGSNAVRRTSIATGATSTVASVAQGRQLAVSPDGQLYVTTRTLKTVIRVDPVTGTTSTFASFASEASEIDAITADATDLYLTLRVSGSSERRIKRIALSDGTVSTFIAGRTDIGVLSLESAGSYLYGTWGLTGGDDGIRRYAKSDAALVNVGGVSQPGYANGTGTDAWFNSVWGIASDGSSLFIADNGNRRLRKAIDADALPSALSPVATTTATLGAAAATTFAGDGVDATVDGPSREASFRQMSGAVVVGPNVYVGTAGSIRKLDLSTGGVSTLSGHATEMGCVDSATASGVRFNGVLDLATDGYYLYSVSPCPPSGYQVRRTSISTGATSTIATVACCIQWITYGPDGKLYATTPNNQGGLFRIDPLGNGYATTTLLQNFYTFAITADDQALYAVTQIPGQTGRQVRRVALPSGSVSSIASFSDSAHTAIESAGDYLYMSSGNAAGIRRVSKLDGTSLSVVGDLSSGYADGIGSAARFSVINGIASDGNMLWIVDDSTSGNRRLRLVADLSFFMGGQSSFGWDGYGGWWDGVNGTLGNFTSTKTDVSVATVGPDLAVSRTYNSLDTRIGAFGTGWSFAYEMTWKPIGIGGVAVLHPDGRREVHTRNLDGSYKAPKGYFSTLASDGSNGFTLTDKDHMVYRLGADRKLSSITDSNGRRLDLAYQDGKLASATDAVSGRQLSFAWTGSHITAVSTDAVAAHGGPLTWRYYYSGDLLERACDARDNAQTGVCTVYIYTAGKLTRITRPKGNTEIDLAYLANGKVDWRADGLGNLTDLAYPSRKTVTVTDPRLNATTQLYDDEHRLTQETDALGKVTAYEYDSSGNRKKITDPNNNATVMTYDARGNLASSTDGEGDTTYKTYDADDNLIVSRDARSASATDNTYAIRYEYDTAGNKTKETGPPTADFPAGIMKLWTYTTGAEPAIGGGVMPRGLLRTEVDGRGNTTTSSYDAKGDLREILSPVGLRTGYAYDELGRKSSETVTSDAFPGGVTTGFSYDQAGNQLTVTNPAILNGISLVTHRQKTTNVYDTNSNLVSATVADLTGGEASRLTSYAYDALDRQFRVTDAEGGVLERTFDGAGNVAQVTDQESRITVTDYDSRNMPIRVIAKNFVDDPIAGTTPRDIVLKATSYDPAGRKLTETDAEGRVQRYAYDKANRVLNVTLENYVDRDGSTRNIVAEASTYDPAGNVLTETTGGGKRKLVHTYDAAGRRITSTLDPNDLNRVTTFAFDAAGNLVSRRLSDGSRIEETRFAYDAGNRKTSETVENGATDLVTSYGYDQRGNMVSMTDPRGVAVPAAFTTDYVHDELNRLTRTTLPPIQVEENGGVPTAARPVTEAGYDTFSYLTHAKDPRGNITVTAYDKLNRRILITHPSYTPPGGTPIQPTESYAYDAVGNLTAQTSRRGHTTDYDFDNLNRVVRQRDPLLTGEAARGVVRSTYDDVGNRRSLVDQRGARTEWTYDKLNRARTETAIVRRDGLPSLSLVTTYDYDDLGNQIFAENPAGEIKRSTYSAASELSSVTDALSKITTYAHDVAGRQIEEIDPLDRATRHTFDLAGRKTDTRRYDRNGTLLTTTGFAYDAAGNQTSITTPRGFTTTYTHDADNRLGSVVQPVSAVDSILTTYGYDAAGNNSRATNGENRSTILTYTTWNLLEDVIEPSTTQHPNAADRTFRNVYDAGGLGVEERQPGGVTITRSFDELGRLRSESGSGGGAAAASRALGYDLAGLRTSAEHPSGTQAFAYDDRKLLTSSTGPAGNTTFGYDAVGRMTNRTDPAGAHTFGWTARSELASAADPLTGVTRTYSWDDAGQLTTVRYGSGASVPVRSLGFDDLSRLTSDVLTDSAGGVTARLEYGYDLDGDVTSQRIDLAANPLTGLHTYGYDRAGRVSSWTRPDGGSTVYGWDRAGNRVLVGSATFTYDERNRLTSTPAAPVLPGIPDPLLRRNYTHTARGTLSQVSDGVSTTTYSFDALGRLANFNGSVAYSYDALDRIATRGAQSFTYSGDDLDPVSDGTFTYSRTPAGRLLALQSGATTAHVGLNRHGDLTYLASATGAVSATRVYDPFGDVAAQTGSTNPTVGFQGDYTDPSSEKVWMGARWYEPETAFFLSRDSYSGELRTPVSLNRYTYAHGNPLTFFDPDGRRVQEEDEGREKSTVKAAQMEKERIAKRRSQGLPDDYDYLPLAQRRITIAAMQGRDFLSDQLRLRDGRGFSWADGARSVLGETSLSLLKGFGDLGRGVAESGGKAVWVAFHPDKAVNALTNLYRREGWRGVRDAFNRNFNPVYMGMEAADRYLWALRTGEYGEAARSGVHLSASAGLAVYGAGKVATRVGASISAAERALAPQTAGWTLPRSGGGANVGGRWYTEHALERMAPRTPQVMAELESRALARAEAAGLKPGTREFGEWWRVQGPDPRNIPPMVVEAEIANPGSTGIRVITGPDGRVITVIPGG